EPAHLGVHRCEGCDRQRGEVAVRRRRAQLAYSQWLEPERAEDGRRSHHPRLPCEERHQHLQFASGYLAGRETRVRWVGCGGRKRIASRQAALCLFLTLWFPKLPV